MKTIAPALLIYGIVFTACLCAVSFCLNYRISAIAFSIALAGELWLWLDGLNARMDDVQNAFASSIPPRQQRRHGLKLVKGETDHAKRL